MKTIAEKIVWLAKTEVGVEEIDGTNCGPRVNEYKAATNLPPDEAWPWCAAFCCWLVREAMKTDGPYTFKRPTTAGAFAFENWSKAQDDSTHTKRDPGDDIRAGDILIFKFSHIGIATGSPERGFVKTVEGNTDGAGSREGGGVYAKRRRIEQVKTRIRFTV